jgi:hypothetical protein
LARYAVPGASLAERYLGRVRWDSGSAWMLVGAVEIFFLTYYMGEQKSLGGRRWLLDKLHREESTDCLS